VINSACRCSYGFKELGILCKDFAFVFVAVLIAVILEVVVVFVGGIFI
jgi:hypothetical protein